MPLFWSGLIATLLDLVNPALNERVSWPWFVACQLAFGLVGGFVIAQSTQIGTMQSWGFAERAFIKAPGVVPPDKRRASVVTGREYDKGGSGFVGVRRACHCVTAGTAGCICPRLVARPPLPAGERDFARLACFLGGLTALFLALESPLDYF